MRIGQFLVVLIDFREKSIDGVFGIGFEVEGYRRTERRLTRDLKHRN